MSDIKVVWEGTLNTGLNGMSTFKAQIVNDTGKLVLLRVTRYGGEVVIPAAVDSDSWIRALVETAQRKP